MNSSLFAQFPNGTGRDRVREFLEFATEFAEQAEQAKYDKTDIFDESKDPLSEYLDAVRVHSKLWRQDEDVDNDHGSEVVGENEGYEGSDRVTKQVRKIDGATKPEVRDKLMLAFNSPLFPEILVTSSVMGEGVDLHRFCRHVIHHDLCWNPSTLEQRIGRLDRVQCKAEKCSISINVYEPFIAGSADEKMIRVLRDRQRWFQIVMGQKFEFDEVDSELIASRVPLPIEIATTLTFDLSCWSDKTVNSKFSLK